MKLRGFGSLIGRLLITWLAWHHALFTLNLAKHEYFDFRVREAISRIQQRMQAYQQVLFGVGSSEVIASAISAFTSDTKPMITASPTYDIIVQLARATGKAVVEVPLTPQWSYPVKQLVEEAKKANAGRDAAVARRNAAGRLLWTLAGDLPGFEEAARSLYAGRYEDLETRMAGWPTDLRDHVRRLLGPAEPTACSGDPRPDAP